MTASNTALCCRDFIGKKTVWTVMTQHTYPRMITSNMESHYFNFLSQFHKLQFC